MDTPLENESKSRRGLLSLDHPRQPELVFGLVAPIGTPIEGFVGTLGRALQQRGYTTCVHKLSKFLDETTFPNSEYIGTEKFRRYMRLMDQGDLLREKTATADILALYAVSELLSERPLEGPKHKNGTAQILRQLKHPEEVYRLRSIYGDAFILLGLYCPRPIRVLHLSNEGMSTDEIDQLIRRDEEEFSDWGQKLVDTFHLADVFLEVRGAAGDRVGQPTLDNELTRFLDLLFGRGIVTPTKDEHAMFIAYAAALRSSSLARQVGASILSAEGELLSTGTNEVPAYGGGQYWGELGKPDGRDHKKGVDLSDSKKFEMIAEILAKLDSEWNSASEDEKEKRVEAAASKLKGTQLMSLTEFMRPVHAEMEALSAAVRTGIRVRGATMYTTTFPCHGCAKHIVAAGIDKVIYVEPYTKSHALKMYDDAITVDEEREENKVRFLPFVGVAPRKYLELFARSTKEGRKLKAKNSQGVPSAELGFRLGSSPYSYVEREGIAAQSLEYLKEERDDVFSDTRTAASEPKVGMGDRV
ncbi:MAG TPA: anti-phage dCTP deaminase [Longimicrobium sp.]|nr:anti-phage dCTP deaminase [Longimicrobium sp.]